MIVILKILSIFSAVVIVFCCAVPASAATDSSDTFNPDDYVWTLAEQCSPSKLVSVSTGRLEINSLGEAVLSSKYTYMVAKSIFGLYSTPKEVCKVIVIGEGGIYQAATRIDGKVSYKEFNGSFTYYGSLMQLTVKVPEKDNFIFRGAKLYTGRPKTLPDKYPSVPTALTFILSCFSSMFVLITNNPVFCIGLSLFAIGGAIGLFNKIKG